MIYSGKIDALAGVMTFTSDSFVVFSSRGIQLYESTNHLQERPESSRANHGSVVTKDVDNIRYQPVKLCLVRKMNGQSKKDI